MAEDFAAAADGDAGAAATAEAAAADGDAGAPATAEKTGEGEDQKGLEDTVTAEDGAEADEDAAAEFLEVMKDVLQRAETEPQAEWSEAWGVLGLDSANERHAVTALFEAALSGTASLEVASSLAVELVRTQRVDMKSVELALQAITRRLEDFVQVNNSAWHLHSQILGGLFPKTASTTWGLQRSGWTWASWWALTEKVLSAADSFRAFDILVSVLQTCQEKSEANINQLQVWKEGGRGAKVRKVLCAWAEMDDTSIAETLAAYDVEL